MGLERQSQNSGSVRVGAVGRPPAATSNIVEGDYLGIPQFRVRVGAGMSENGALAFIASDTSQNGRFAFLDRDLVTERVSILNAGNVGIGTTAPEYRLDVIGDVRISGDLIWMDPGASVPDYVFIGNHKRMQMDELEKFVASEKHLPNMPAAAEIRDKGLNLSEFQMKLLEKIEELTIYTIQQAKTIALKEAEIANQDARLAALEQAISNGRH